MPMPPRGDGAQRPRNIKPGTGLYFSATWAPSATSFLPSDPVDNDEPRGARFHSVYELPSKWTTSGCLMHMFPRFPRHRRAAVFPISDRRIGKPDMVMISYYPWQSALLADPGALLQAGGSSMPLFKLVSPSLWLPARVIW